MNWCLVAPSNDLRGRGIKSRLAHRPLGRESARRPRIYAMCSVRHSRRLSTSHRLKSPRGGLTEIPRVPWTLGDTRKESSQGVRATLAPRRRDGSPAADLRAALRGDESSSLTTLTDGQPIIAQLGKSAPAQRNQGSSSRAKGAATGAPIMALADDAVTLKLDGLIGFSMSIRSTARTMLLVLAIRP